MSDTQQPGHQEAKPEENPAKARTGRTWTERLVQPLKYRRYAANGAEGKRYIYFEFELPKGETRIPQAAYDILKEMTTMNGRTHTGLKCVRSSRQVTGTLWSLPNTPVGRAAAEVVDAKLLDLAHLLEAEQGHSR